MRRDALTENGRVRLEWLPPLRRMTRSARELERLLRDAETGSERQRRLEAIRHCVQGGLAEWSSARELVKLHQQPRKLLRDGRANLAPEELTDLLGQFADDLEARVRLVRGWTARPSSPAPSRAPVATADRA